MPFVYFGTGWFIGIALASALHLPIELLLPAFFVSIVGLFLWRHDQRARLIWLSVAFALAGVMWFTLRLPRFDQSSLSTYNGIGVVTIEGVIDAPPDVRDTYINLLGIDAGLPQDVQEDFRVAGTSHIIAISG